MLRIFRLSSFIFFFFNDTATTEIYTLSLHDALPILCDELLEALRLLSGSEAVRVITLTGAGRAFCAGADLGVLGSEGPALVAAGKDVALALRAAPQPVLGVVNGAAAGGGANLALACDYR